MNTSRERYFRVGTRIHGIYDHTRTHHNLLYLRRHVDVKTSLGVFDWASSVTYVLTDWTFLTIWYSTGTGNEVM